LEIRCRYCLSCGSWKIDGFWPYEKVVACLKGGMLGIGMLRGVGDVFSMATCILPLEYCIWFGKAVVLCTCLLREAVHQTGASVSLSEFHVGKPYPVCYCLSSRSDNCVISSLAKNSHRKRGNRSEQKFELATRRNFALSIFVYSRLSFTVAGVVASRNVWFQRFDSREFIS
jgi:hypothetical protein